MMEIVPIDKKFYWGLVIKIVLFAPLFVFTIGWVIPSLLHRYESSLMMQFFAVLLPISMNFCFIIEIPQYIYIIKKYRNSRLILNTQTVTLLLNNNIAQSYNKKDACKIEEFSVWYYFSSLGHLYKIYIEEERKVLYIYMSDNYDILQYLANPNTHIVSKKESFPFFRAR